MNEQKQLLARRTDYSVSIFDPNYIAYKFLIPDLKSAINTYASGTVLDIGCGNKPYLSFFPKDITQYIGCDIEQSSLKLVDIICPATDLKIQDNSMDTVFCTQVLEHVYDHKKAFFEISRVLKPNGYIIGSLPMTWPHHEEPYDFFRFTKYGLTELMREVGLTPVYIKANGGKWALTGQMLMLSFTEKPKHPSILSKVKNILFRATLGKVWLNLIFSTLDRLSSHDKEHNTLNFVFVARKEKNVV